ncbi:Uncharacterized protein SCF082_LOCUS342 [Durusdinium trenchii]
MKEIMDESVAARKKSMALGSVNYAGELSTQLLEHAEKMEKRYKTLQQALNTGVTDQGFFDKCFRVISKERKWYTSAEAAANSILSGLNRASKAKKREKGKKGEGSDKSKGKKDPK